MQYEEQQLINGLFERLKQTGQQNSQRDIEAERQIAEFVKQQPAAPYYMAQSILIQEAALKRMQARVQQLESELAAEKSKPSTGGSFLGGLFGGGKSAPQPNNSWNTQPQQPPAQDYSRAAAAPASAAPHSGGFMAGALQTAAGVAGGVVLAEMLTSMFHQSRPEEIVNIIEEPATPAGGESFLGNQYDDVNNVSDNRFLNQDDQFGNNNDAWQNDDFDDNDYSNDDDSFI
ncbi:hypothetical protein SAMN05192562_1011492 [Kosakonia arachidis]|uniref:DUF2076 domain-containing protein n=1 Tax=Kosakonia arachidis TaxID=551989 RepID=A0A1I7A0M8_9ENTR|nr:DUF2076 domain-containing protein [Kosakonia arachidis]SFT68473.1 hypothetical protein SAMN05192562_1011492 [Kosakonia arachidis]